MQQNYQDTKLPTATSTSASIGGVSWANPNNITADDASSSTLLYLSGGDSGASITAQSFDLQNLPDAAVIDGIGVYFDGSQTGCYGSVSLGGITGVSSKDIGTLSGEYGGSSDLWGAESIDPAEIASLSVTVDTGDVSGGDGNASIDYVAVTVYWHIDPLVDPVDVPTRVAYKVYSRDGAFLGELPNVVSDFAFSQDINSAGSSIEVTCAKYLSNDVVVDNLLTEAEEIITTESDLDILTTETSIVVAQGSSEDNAMFKNSNRLKVWLYNYWYPNGKLVFSGQVNRLTFGYGSGNSLVRLMVYSDGVDLGNYIARGLSGSYTTDVSETSGSGSVGNFQSSVIGYRRSGQTFTTGAAITNVGAIALRLSGSATVTLNLYDAPNGNLLGSATKTIAIAGDRQEVQFDFPQLVEVSSSTQYFFGLQVQPGQSITVENDTGAVYAGGSAYLAEYSGGSGGGLYAEYVGDLWFITKQGNLVTTTTYTDDDPVSDMMSAILADYNNRGGYITEREFTATGLSLTYTFNQATIFDALLKVIEMSPSGYYSFIDLGTAELDIKEVSDTAEFTLVKGRDVEQLDISFTIEQVKNNFLFSGGDTGGGENLFKYYKDTQSTAFYGVRTSTGSDNRVTQSDTADAIGETFIEENADESQETKVTVFNKSIDITLLEVGKTIGFRNFGPLIDSMVLQIVRREFRPHAVSLTLGRLPISTSLTIQQINRELLLEQTINNPDEPS